MCMTFTNEEHTLDEWKRILKTAEKDLGVNHPEVSALRKWLIILALRQIPNLGATTKDKIIARLREDAKLRYPGAKKVALRIKPVKPKVPLRSHLK